MNAGAACILRRWAISGASPCPVTKSRPPPPPSAAAALLSRRLRETLITSGQPPLAGCSICAAPSQEAVYSAKAGPLGCHASQVLRGTPCLCQPRHCSPRRATCCLRRAPTLTGRFSIGALIKRCHRQAGGRTPADSSVRGERNTSAAPHRPGRRTGPGTAPARPPLRPGRRRSGANSSQLQYTR